MPETVDGHVHVQLEGMESMSGRPHGWVDYDQATARLSLSRYAVLVMAPRADLEQTRRLNDLAVQLTDQDPRAFALCSVHPSDGGSALAEIDRVAELGCSGLKLHPNTQRFDVADDGVRDVVQRAGERGLPVLFDSIPTRDPGQPEKFVELAFGCPDTDLVLAHSFGPKFAQARLFALLTKYPGTRRNVYLELSATVSLFADSPFSDQLAWVCRQHGLDRVLWGSDYPLFSPRGSLESLSTYGFDPAEFAQITRHTAESVYHLI